MWLLLKRKGALVAIQGGGHTRFAGAANVANGITIDLRGLNAIDVAPNEVTAPSGTGTVSNDMYDGDFAVNDTSANIVSVGGGSTRGDVYNVLQPKNLIAVGGRGASLGVGGLTIGGRSPCFTVFLSV